MRHSVRKKILRCTKIHLSVSLFKNPSVYKETETFDEICYRNH